MENIEKDVGGSVVGDVESTELNLNKLRELAQRIDETAGVDPPKEPYSLAEAVAAILNGGTIDQINVAFELLKGWSFTPEGGWPHDIGKEQPGE